MKIYFRLLIISIAMTCSFCNASCSNFISTIVKTVQFGSVIVQRDAAIGSVIATVSAPATSQKIIECTATSITEYDQMMYLGGAATSITNVYQTNIPGVGITGNWGASDIYKSPTNVVSWANGGPTYMTDNPAQTFQLIKTDNIISGVLTNGFLARNSFAGTSYDSIQVYLSGSSVTQVACSITTPNLTFPIGDILASTFGTTVGTTPTAAKNTQNLGLNCDAGANINVSLSGTQNPDVSTTSVLALTGQGSAGVAKGVGVQILYNSTPLILNNRIVLKQSSGGQETFPLTARYYQTKTSVATGSANASATLNLTYQ
jgi:type 1 fimbria pilin